jgi:hypothetical protein
MTEQIESTPQSGMTRDSDAVSSIADLLGNVEPKQEQKVPEKKLKPQQESDEDLPLSDDSTDEVEAEDEESQEDDQETSEEEVTWAKALGVDEKQLVLDENGDFAGVKVKVDGKVSSVPLNDLIAGYQSNKSNTNKSKAIAEERKVLESHKAGILQEYTKKLEDASALTTYLENSMIEEFQGIDWNSLRYQNPAEYAAMVQDYNLKTSRIQQIKDAIGITYGQEKQKLTAEQTQQVQQYVQDQINKAIELNPVWADTKVFKKDLSEMQNFVGETYGFTPQEFAEVRDARFLEVIKDAKKYREGKNVASKKVEQKVAKYQKPVGTAVKTLTKLDKLKKAAKQTSGYAQRDAQRDAVAELLYGGGD